MTLQFFATALLPDADNIGPGGFSDLRTSAEDPLASAIRWQCLSSSRSSARFTKFLEVSLEPDRCRCTPARRAMSAGGCMP